MPDTTPQPPSVVPERWTYDHVSHVQPARFLDYWRHCLASDPALKWVRYATRCTAWTSLLIAIINLIGMVDPSLIPWPTDGHPFFIAHIASTLFALVLWWLSTPIDLTATLLEPPR